MDFSDMFVSVIQTTRLRRNLSQIVAQRPQKGLEISFCWSMAVPRLAQERVTDTGMDVFPGITQNTPTPTFGHVM